MNWKTPPPTLTLAPDEIHIWKARLNGQPSYLQLLSDDEKKRASRFIFEKHRNRFIAGRAILRKILGNYLRVEPQEVCFAYQANGKPELRITPLSPVLRGEGLGVRGGQQDPLSNCSSLSQALTPSPSPGVPGEGGQRCGTQPLHFNLAHTGDLVVYALTLDTEVGIDVEQVRPYPEAAPMAKRFFSPEEQNWLFGHPPAERDRAFFRLWTHKEAYLKVQGRGIGVPLDQFAILPGQQSVAGFSICEFEPEADFVAVLIGAGDRKKAIGYSFSPQTSRSS